MKNAIVIDGNNLLYRALKTFSRLSYDGKSTSMIYGFPNILRSLITQLNADQVFVVFDGGKRSAYRLKLLPGYKDRDKGDDFDFEDFKRQKEAVIKGLEILGVPVIVKRGWEADDIIWLVARRLKRTRKVIIVTTDKDFNQFISKQVSIWNPFKNLRISHKNAYSVAGYHPHETVDWLVLDGDKSDCIPGVPGFGKVTIRKFLDQFGSIKNYLTKDLGEFGKHKKRDIEEIYLLNRQLIDVRLLLRREKATLKSLDISLEPKNKLKKKKLRGYISTYDLRSLEKENFLKAFKRLNY